MSRVHAGGARPALARGGRQGPAGDRARDAGPGRDGADPPLAAGSWRRARAQRLRREPVAAAGAARGDRRGRRIAGQGAGLGLPRGRDRLAVGARPGRRRHLPADAPGVAARAR
ncbi:MAG: hypothetical protein EDQ89_09185 [Acidobacteria bacterium]|nr:MAG: hypothetical protein EDQ89_09185 [Acidobacteriota bacterium]